MKVFLYRLALVLCFTICALNADAQTDDAFTTDDGVYNPERVANRMSTSDSVQSQHKQVVRGISVWTIDPLTGDRFKAVPDTAWYMSQNRLFDEGMQGEYNTLGNNGTPRINRILTDRRPSSDFMFVDGYDFFLKRPQDFHFTNTYSPITNLQYNNCGNSTTGEDNFRAIFATNAGKRIGMGIRFDYLYDLGYYANQAASHFGTTVWMSYLGDEYQAHLIMSLNNQKVSENGGILLDDYIVRPQLFSQSYNSNEIPTQLQHNYNRNSNQHIFFNHRYSLGFYRKVPMTPKEIEAKKFAMAAAKEKADREAKEKRSGKDDDDEKKSSKQSATQPSLGRPKDAKIVGDESSLTEAQKNGKERIVVDSDAKADSLLAESKKKEEEDMWMKKEYVPTTSIFHTLKLDNYKRNYAYNYTPEGYYANDYYADTDSTFDDETSLFQLENTLGVALLEGFNKYAAFGIKAFVTHHLEKFWLPESQNSMQLHTDNNISVGAQLSRQQGKLLHFNVTGELYVVGEKIGQTEITGHTDLNFKLFGDTVRLALGGGYALRNPSHYLRSYHSRHFWWDETLNKEGHGRIEGIFSFPKTGTSLRIAYDNFVNYTYLGTSYTRTSDGNQQSTTITPRQMSSNLSVLTAQLMQNFRLGILHWDNTITYQKSTDDVIAAVPDLNIYSALYLRFKIAHVLDCDLGADVRYYTQYNAPEYSPQLSSYVVQENDAVRTKTGNYPYVNAFINFQLKYCRFFIMMSHVNGGNSGEYFLTPHYPMNQRVLRFGLNWNFWN